MDLSFQIDQGGKTTTNCELPTTNWNNQSDDLDCYLMMDPAIVEGVEAALGLEAFRRALKDHPTAEQLVIHREGGMIFIRPQITTTSDYAKNRSDNLDIGETLKSLVPSKIANDNNLFPNNLIESKDSLTSFPLTAEGLREILDRVDKEDRTKTSGGGFFGKLWGKRTETSSRENGSNITVPNIPCPDSEEVSCLDDCKYSGNSSVKCDRRSTSHQSDFSNINQPITSKQQEVTAIRPTDRIVIEMGGYWGDELAPSHFESSDNQIDKYLRNEICNNIYTQCLAEVASSSLKDRGIAEGTLLPSQENAQEATEWAAAKEAAVFYKELAEIDYERAQKATAEAEKAVIEAKKTKNNAEKAYKKAQGIDQAEAQAHIDYQQALLDYSDSDYKAKKLNEELALTKRETAIAQLKVIKVRNTTQHLTAKTEFDNAIEKEKKACFAVEKFQENVDVKAQRVRDMKMLLTIRQEYPEVGSSSVDIDPERRDEAERGAQERARQEKREWMAEKAKASFEKELAEIKLTSVRKETEVAERDVREAKQIAAQAKQVVLGSSDSLNHSRNVRARIYANMLYTEARASYATHDYEVKKLIEKLALVNLKKAIARQQVIAVRNTAQSAAAESEYDMILAEEKNAYEAVAKAKNNFGKQADDLERRKALLAIQDQDGKVALNVELSELESRLDTLRRGIVNPPQEENDDSSDVIMRANNGLDYEKDMMKRKSDEYHDKAKAAKLAEKEYASQHWSIASTNARIYAEFIEENSDVWDNDRKWNELLKGRNNVYKAVKAAEAYPGSWKGYLWP